MKVYTVLAPKVTGHGQKKGNIIMVAFGLDCGCHHNKGLRQKV